MNKTDLKKHSLLLSKEFNLTDNSLKLISFLIEKSKPSLSDAKKLFKELLPKYNKVKKYKFVALSIDQSTFLFLDVYLPLDKVETLLNVKQVLLKKKKKNGKKEEVESIEIQVEFLKELETLRKKVKAFAAGEVEFSRAVREGANVYFEIIPKASNYANYGPGSSRKEVVKLVSSTLQYHQTKQGQLLTFSFLEKNKKTKDEEVKDVADAANEMADADLKRTIDELQSKLSEESSSLKKWAYTNKILMLLDQFDDIPEIYTDTYTLLTRKSEHMQDSYALSINTALDEFNDKLDGIAKGTLKSTQQIQADILNLKQKQKNWEKIVVDQKHPRKEEIDSLIYQLSVLKKAEKLITPLIEQFYQTDSSDSTMRTGLHKEKLKSKILQIRRNVFDAVS